MYMYIEYSWGKNASDISILIANRSVFKIYGTNCNSSLKKRREQELRFWFVINAKFSSTSPRFDFAFSLHHPLSTKY